MQNNNRRKMVEMKGVAKYFGTLKALDDVDLDVYEPKLYRMRIREPLILSGDKAKKVDISVKSRGGGISGQADAIRLAIGKGLSQFYKDSKLDDTLSKYDRQLLVADVRRKETSKPNRHGQARAKRQKSYR